MTELLNLTEEQRKIIFNQVGFRTSLSPVVVEKDWWVTLTLKAVFRTQFREHLLFKGGTSLSKCWRLINRFSEDIDLAIDRDYLGFGGDLSKTRIKALKKATSLFTGMELHKAIDQQLHELGVPPGITTLTARPVPDNSSHPDPRELMLHYRSLYDPIDYIVNSVRIEVSGRSLMQPWSTRPIQSFVGEEFPAQPWAGQPFEVAAVEPRRTFIEKLFLLHEEFQKPSGIRHLRMSRHLYDIVRIKDTVHGWRAIMDRVLYNEVRKHREKFFHLPDVDYSTHQATSINFIPPLSMRQLYEEDYRVMRERMIGGDAPTFKLLISELEKLTQRLRIPIGLQSTAAPII